MSVLKLMLMGPMKAMIALVFVAIMLLALYIFFGPLLTIGIFLTIVGLGIEVATVGKGKEGHILLFIGIIITIIGYFVG